MGITNIVTDIRQCDENINDLTSDIDELETKFRSEGHDQQMIYGGLNYQVKTRWKASISQASVEIRSKYARASPIYIIIMQVGRILHEYGGKLKTLIGERFKKIDQVLEDFMELMKK